VSKQGHIPNKQEEKQAIVEDPQIIEVLELKHKDFFFFGPSILGFELNDLYLQGRYSTI
jgi:hypothetical protein